MMLILSLKRLPFATNDDDDDDDDEDDKDGHVDNGIAGLSRQV